MAISVKDIQEKEFGTQASGGYNIEQVDDFLDEISEQMAALVRENLELNRQIKSLEGEVRLARSQAEAAEAKTPDYNEKSYFSNLQNAMRESLIGAQRIADETMEEANRKAQKTVSDAQVQADQITVTAREKADGMIKQAQQEADQLTADVKGRMETLEARYEALKASATSFKADFSRILEQQQAALRESNGLF
ncbi:MAG: DivIVA domain-containing protein [Clostridia bacterium]|nr:DivIVA domain-containing protein [Clostridia bacterium]